MIRIKPMMGMVAVCLIAGVGQLAFAATVMPGMPQVFFAGAQGPANTTSGPPTDYYNLFDARSDRQWPQARSIVSAFGLNGILVSPGRHSPYMSIMLQYLKEHHIALWYNANVVTPGSGCGYGEGYADPPEVLLRRLQYIKSFIGNVEYVSLDEPFMRGHMIRDIGHGQVDCQFSIAETAARTVRSIQETLSVFPNAKIMDQINLNKNMVTHVSPTEWVGLMEQWADAYKAANSKYPDYVAVDIQEEEPGWQPQLQSVALCYRAHHITQRTVIWATSSVRRPR